MAFGEPRLDRADDIAAVISEMRESLAIVATRQRMNLSARDVAELARLNARLDWLHRHVLDLRASVSAEYRLRIGK